MWVFFTEVTKINRRKIAGEIVEFNESREVAIPSGSVKYITCESNIISIRYFDGDYESNSAGSAFPMIKTAKLLYRNEEKAAAKLKEFYWAVAKNTGAFHF